MSHCAVTIGHDHSPALSFIREDDVPVVLHELDRNDRLYLHPMSQGHFFVACDSPDCAATFKVMAYEGEDPEHFAERCGLRLSEAGWTKRRDGRDLCWDCSPQKL